MKNKFLVIINNLDEINVLKNNGVYNFLYPLKSFSVGFINAFDIEEIKEENSYVYVNRILTSIDIDNLVNILSNINSNIKGIVFDDIGLIEALKDINITKILYNNHYSTNYKSINIFLESVDSVVVSSDITLNEVNEILKNSNKELCIYGYGHLNLSYSRRLLNTNYSNYFNVPKKNILKIKNTDYEFINVENNYGTVIYENKVFNGLEEKYADNIKFVIINLFNTDTLSFLDKSTYTGFLHKKTIYKLKEEK